MGGAGSSSSSWTLVLGAVLLHLMFLSSVFDIYFKSPILPIQRSHAPLYNTPAPARRLILFVADGLRADSFFSYKSRSPYLRHVVEEAGVWGVSHTRVPTESRPGHVALIAGMYEDPSAITKGWQENPVDFDTVFNQSRYTWSWGSPDILPMFSKGVTGNRMFTDMYSSDFEDFSSNNISRLDTWVFNKVEDFFEKAMTDLGLQMKLREDKVVLFLHLLGCDTNGHRNKPFSKEYLENIATVDSGIERIVGLANKYWRHDGRTAFVFTADHGMTDWGSHGAGMDHETQTPIVAWGAGIREARPFSPTSRTGRRANHPPTPSHWFLDHIDRSDASQADIAPLMSALLGANIPKHSAGQMPTDFLDLHISHKVQANLAVTKQMFEQFKVLSGSFQSAALSGFLHRPFPRLDEKRFQSELGKIDRHVNGARYTDGLRLTSDLYDVAAEGIDYYQKYYRRPLFAAISLSYIGFVVLLSTRLLINFTFLAQVEPLGGVVTLILNVTTLVTVVLVAISTLGQNVPLHFLCYYSAPVIVWHLTLRDVLRVRLANVQSGNRYLTVLKILFPLAVLELLVGAFFDRRVLSVAIFLVCLYQLVRISPSSQPLYLKVAWIFMNLVLAAFTFQPSVSKDRNSTLVLAAGFLASGVQAATSFAGRRQQAPESSLRATVSCCLFPAYLAVSGVCVAASANYTGLVDSSKVQMVSWTVFLSGLPLSLLLSRPNLLPRLSSLLGALLSSYILLSLSYEGLFLLALIGTLTIWLIMEYNESFKYQALAEMTISAGQRERNVIGFGDVTRALLFLYFSVVSFFGTGNIASLNSFDPRSIACLVSIFSPFLMGSLLLGKILIPFLLVALFMQAVKQVSGMASKALFLLLLLFSDVMSLHFFFCVTDQGSWQEIGTSLSHFVIAEGIVIFLLLFFVLAGFLLRFRLQSS